MIRKLENIKKTNDKRTYLIKYKKDKRYNWKNIRFIVVKINNKWYLDEFIFIGNDQYLDRGNLLMIESVLRGLGDGKN